MAKQWILYGLMVGMTVGLSVQGTVHDTLHERRDWTSIDDSCKEHHVIATIAHKLKKHHFICGAASAEYQILGQMGLPNSQMAYGECLMKQTDPSGYACGGFEQHLQDSELLEECGLTAYRFSVDWSALEPFQGDWNEEVLEHYVTFCKNLKSKGIRVMVTLHHFVHPQWFEALGAFECSENIPHFVHFCEKVFDALAPYVDWWCTINEPGIYVFQSYIRGVFPPFKSVALSWIPAVGLKEKWVPTCNARYDNVKLAGRVLCNLLMAHIEIYRTLKIRAAALHCDAQIGFAHQYLKFTSFHPSTVRLTSSPLASIAGKCEEAVGHIITSWINWSVMNFFEHGEFNFIGAQHVSTIMPEATTSFDFVGLNYYSVVFFNLFKGGPDYYAGDIPTDMPYGVYAEGLSDAIRHCGRLGKPIYITENGVDDRQDDRIRSLWIKRHLVAICEALDAGLDVRGLFYWCLLDNWEWDMGYGPKFGLYSVDFKDRDRKRTLKSGSRVYQKIATLCRS